MPLSDSLLKMGAPIMPDHQSLVLALLQAYARITHKDRMAAYFQNG
jgi:hypothetical protein